MSRSWRNTYAMPTIMSVIKEMEKGTARTSRHAVPFMEGLVGALVRFTATLAIFKEDNDTEAPEGLKGAQQQQEEPDPAAQHLPCAQGSLHPSDDRCMREATGDRMLRTALVSTFHRGDASTKQAAESILRRQHKMPDYSVTCESMEF
ncbi:hypothetical protein PR202_ga23464 [Eleusine coracana subsp. coracana]|uniref:Uncharacterized protein n=1 Tax=Eleusine coracana subsp. coracana TaxID=191504 RepID=A0AAV5D592_ELECO|nr:hypothetical protein PR202_ga23464 [Eleusine coracana subsp. coracana]